VRAAGTSGRAVMIVFTPLSSGRANPAMACRRAETILVVHYVIRQHAFDLSWIVRLGWRTGAMLPRESGYLRVNQMSNSIL
jgi:hypothetical protein